MTGSRAGAAQDGAVQEAGQVRYAVINHVAVFTLDWPKALNALSHGMVTQIATRLEACRGDDDIYAIAFTGDGPKAFCAGGDVRGIYALARAGDTAWLDFFIDEYRLDYELHHFPKPVLALMDRITIGGGMGIGQAASVRIVTERTRIAMPETRIGLVPDVGATHFLSGMPAEAELYVGLTGVMLGGGDALALGLADVCVSPAWADGFAAWLAALDWRGGELDIAAAVTAQSVAAGPATHSTIAARLGEISRHFAVGHSVEQMIASLERGLADGAAGTNSGNDDSASGHRPEPAAGEADWRRAALEALQHCSPTMLKVTREALLRGRRMTLADCFRSELAIVRRTISEGDFVEGVRALLVDKDRTPQWRPPTLAAVRDEDVEAYLASPWSATGHPLADLGERAL
jgi:enoyl-CoA hydratase/carnithine racemase